MNEASVIAKLECFHTALQEEPGTIGDVCASMMKLIDELKRRLHILLKPEETNALQDRFADWLATTDDIAFECKAGSFYVTVIRMQKNDDFDYLYNQRKYGGAGIERNTKFDYAGVYCKRDRQVYDSQYDIKQLVGEDGTGKDASPYPLKIVRGRERISK